MADWAKLKVVDLKAELKRRGLPQGGLKAELVSRLEEADQEAEAPAADAQNEETIATEQDAPQDVNGDATGSPAPQEEESRPEETVNEAAPARKEPGPQEPQAEVEPIEQVPESVAPPPEPAPPEAQTADNGPAQQEPSPEPAAPAAEPSHATDAVNEEAPASAEPASRASVDSVAEAQKRKRRSASPTPKEEDISRKRARADKDMPTPPKTQLGDQPEHQDEPAPAADHDRHVEPSIHPATSALFINNLMRPMRPADLRAHVATLAAPPGTETPSEDSITKFHLDFIRTHAFVALSDMSAASRVRQRLHGRIWPNESNRKALSIDFIPPEKIDDWIDMEEAAGGRRPGHRWEVVYTPSQDGSTVEATLVSSSLSSSSTRPPPPPPAQPSTSKPTIADGINSAPLGPRGQFSNAAPPTGPRGPRGRPSQSSDHPPWGEAKHTRARPVIAYYPVSEDLARRRVDNMRSFYTRDLTRDLGREINRYSFEDGDSFVDRGREIFEGIRPPHRERGGRGGGGGRGRGGSRRGQGGGFRPRSDRYIPGGGGSGGGSGRDDSDRRRY